MKFRTSKVELQVKGIYNSVYPSLNYQEEDYLVTEPRDSLTFSLEGIDGNRHFGYQTLSQNRLKQQYEKGTVVRNNRQWLAITPSEVLDMQKKLGIEKPITPELLGANLLLDGVDNLSNLQPMTYIVISPHEKFEYARPTDIYLVVYAAALPCNYTGRNLAKAFQNESLKKEFARKIGRRGITGWVEKGGSVKVGYKAWILTPRGID